MKVEINGRPVPQELTTVDNRQINLPNGALTNTAIVNYTREGTRRPDLVRDIVQQTYAAEIIFGLLLLIASFSFVLLYTDGAAFDGRYTNALWYCFAVVTTIGFGDMTAVSTIGRILSVVLGIYGIVVVALITSIIVNFYGEMKKSGTDDADAVPEEEQESEENACPEAEKP